MTMSTVLAVAVATIAGMAVGALWFSKAVFGMPWARAVGVELGANATPSTLSIATVATAVTAIVQAIATAGARELLGGPPIVVALAVAALGWLGFTAARTAVEYGFEQRPRRLYAIDMGHQLAVVLVMGLVLGLFGI